MLHRTAPLPAPTWCRGEVVELEHPNPDAVILRLRVRDQPAFLPGQHYMIKLTADDGYSASRSYSVASAPYQDLLEFYVERLDDGEVSPYLAEDVEVGDRLQLRGPIGGWFVWDGAATAVGIGGGTGVVPLVSMLRQATHENIADRLSLVAVARTFAELPYADELATAGVPIVLTREDTTTGRAAGHLLSVDLETLVRPEATYYICGSPGFADSASQVLTDLDVPPGVIRIERFGPTG
ncbi:MAG TPA: FAD-binding oxidoreductase [Propionibacteriaceae bacterium]|jgi:ferredoxin-NADP reductase|nr:FAD-binding oxidoreductase [Propionibacteriaceae bacterium]